MSGAEDAIDGVGQASPRAIAAADSRRGPALLKLIVVAVGVALAFALVRLAAPQPWSQDEYYHFAMAREMLSHFRITSLPWAPWTAPAGHFADGSPLFHWLLMPLARLPIERAAPAAAALGQTFLVGAFAWALWSVRAPRPWWFVLALAGLGPIVGYRVEMVRPQVWLIGFTVLTMALLVERRWKTLLVAAALFGLAHAGGWISIPMAALWCVATWVEHPAGEPRLQWQPLAATGAGWLLGQLAHPALPENFRQLALATAVVPFEATAGDALLRSQLGLELFPPDALLLRALWPALVAPALLLLAWWWLPAVRSRATTTAGVFALAFFGVGVLAMRRMIEIGAPLALLALALMLREARDRGSVVGVGRAGRLAGGGLVIVAVLWTFGTLLEHDVQSPPHAMAEWLGRAGAPGERVFTASWADSAPLFYFAPQLRSLVLLDPTPFYRQDRRLFERYVTVVEGLDADPRRAIREQFGARWVTLWKAPAFWRLARQLVPAPGVRVAYADADYLVLDLGPVGPPDRP